MNIQSNSLYTPDAAGSIPVYAGFFRRAAAFAIDFILFMIVYWLLFTALLGSMSFESVDSNSAANNAIGWIMMTMICLYSALMESSPVQGTLGKMALGIKVTTMDGKRLSFINALGRALLKIGSLIFMFIGCLIALFTKKHQAFHDLPVGSIVVMKDQNREGAGFQVERFTGPQEQAGIQTQVQPPVPTAQPAGGSVTGDWNINGTIVKAALENVQDLVKSEFLQGLSSTLRGAGIPAAYSHTDVPIKLQGRFILIDEGHRALRYFTSGLSGKARIETEGVLLVNGAAVANLYARHEMGRGFFVFGGDSQKLLGTCARNCGLQIAHQAVNILKTRKE